MRQALERLWYRPGAHPWPLWPLSAAYRVGLTLRRALARPWRAAVPVLVVGNLTVGGTGKTPVVLAVVEWLRAQGWRPGVASRGYGGRGPFPLRVDPATAVASCGDEPLLLCRRARVPVTVDPRRPRAVADLVARGCDVVVCDDGLQHYALARDAEIVVVDGIRGLGNGSCLPAGPLREPPARLRTVGLVLVNGGDWCPSSDIDWARLEPEPGALVSLVDQRRVAASAWPGSRRVHALAGIGHPARFFATLRALGFDPIEHPLPDHQPLRWADLPRDGRPVILTEKDAMRLPPEGAVGGVWYLPITVQLPRVAREYLYTALRGPKESSPA